MLLLFQTVSEASAIFIFIIDSPTLQKQDDFH